MKPQTLAILILGLISLALIGLLGWSDVTETEPVWGLLGVTVGAIGAILVPSPAS